MSVAVIDAREWQNSFDLASGARIPLTGSACKEAARVLSLHPYPGDLEDAANQWVTDTALDLMGAYGPQLICLTYAQQFFSLRHFPHSKKDGDRLRSAAMDEAFRFIRLSGCIPVVVGTGALVPLEAQIDLSGLDGMAVSSNWSARYCGVHYPSDSDLKALESMAFVERIVSKNQWVEVMRAGQVDLDMPDDMDLLPDVLVVARPGTSFKALGATLRRPVMVPAPSFRVPVHTPLGRVADLRELKSLVLSALKAPGTRPVALILVEGVGQKDFCTDYFMAANGVEWFCNEPGDAFYLTVTTGKHQPFAYPQGYRFFDQNEADPPFPFSGYLRKIPEKTLGLDYPGKSIAVGNRSMFMHMVFGADISIECFARNLFNQGCLLVVHDGALEKESI